MQKQIEVFHYVLILLLVTFKWWSIIRIRTRCSVLATRYIRTASSIDFDPRRVNRAIRLYSRIADHFDGWFWSSWCSHYAQSHLRSSSFEFLGIGASILGYLLGLVVSYIAGFLLTYFFGFTKELMLEHNKDN
ncbi:hypothetical protein ACFQZR_08785 [Paenibacillus sp. GCM10027629]|uniref:hypothetical protein n=1 Tax=Paenibacillus sp. GCM10027629 TaxID=3273414 RepID=UPI00362A6D35